MARTRGTGELCWSPSPDRRAASRLAAFQAAAPRAPTDYAELWAWSTADLDGFWAQVWDFCGVIATRPYDRVHGPLRMPGTQWFPGAQLNFAQNLLRDADDRLAIIACGEDRPDSHLTRAQLTALVARAQRGLMDLGVGPGDRVAAVLPNCAQAVVCMLATAAIGAVWSSCSPDFGVDGILDRFGQIDPRVLIFADGYRYQGRLHQLSDKFSAVLTGLPETRHAVVVEFAGLGIFAATVADRSLLMYGDLIDNPATTPVYAPLPFDHPLTILYSSGTTGPPKSIVHGAGNTLITHLKEHQLHTDLHPGDRLFWFTTCGWMMWNWLVSALASQAAIVLYDGSPTTPDATALWRLAARTKVTHFGTSPRFLAHCAQAGVRPARAADLSRLQTVLSTGAPLHPAQFDWVYASLGADGPADIALQSISGGTDIIGCFVAGVPLLPVRRGQLQGRTLGMAVQAWDAAGQSVVGQPGELVCTRPFPSIPLGFAHDPDHRRFHAAYFAANPGVWTHGDVVEVRPDGGVVITGRSDTTLNPGGVRIGTAELYRALEPLAEIVDAIAVGRDTDQDVEVVLCVQLAKGVLLDAALIQRIRLAIRAATTPRHVPAHIFAVPAIPYTYSGKKVEQTVRAIIAGQPVTNQGAVANPGSLAAFAALAFD